MNFASNVPLLEDEMSILPYADVACKKNSVVP
jgi:hypothetical protein